MCILVDMYGPDEALAMLGHLEHRMRTKQGAMKNGPGYLDVAVSSHLDMLKVRHRGSILEKRRGSKAWAGGVAVLLAGSSVLSPP